MSKPTTIYDLLIFSATLAAQLNDPFVSSIHGMIDEPSRRDAYAAGTFPARSSCRLTMTYLRRNRHQRSPPLPTADVFAATLSQGHRERVKVVVYDGGNAMYAGRLWWMLRWLGHTNVYVLDGGFAQWQKEGRAVETQANTRAPASFPATLHDDILLSAADTLASITDPNRRILDARALERYLGDVEPVDPVAGHIPGAVNRAFALNQRRIVQIGDDRSVNLVILAGRAPTQLIHQCGSGVSACANMLAMEHVG